MGYCLTILASSFSDCYEIIIMRCWNLFVHVSFLYGLMFFPWFSIGISIYWPRKTTNDTTAVTASSNHHSFLHYYSPYFSPFSFFLTVSPFQSSSLLPLEAFVCMTKEPKIEAFVSMATEPKIKVFVKAVKPKSKR